MAEAVGGRGRVQRRDVRVPGRDPPALLLAPHLRLPERHHGSAPTATSSSSRARAASRRRCTPDVVSPMALLLEDVELDKTLFFKQMGERMINWREFEALIEPYLSTHTRDGDRDDGAGAAPAVRLRARRRPTCWRTSTSPSAASSRRSRRRPASHACPARRSRCRRRRCTRRRRRSAASANVDVLVGELGYEKGDLTILSDRGVI